MVGKNEKVINLPFTNLFILYESRISIVFQGKLEWEQFFLYLKSSDSDFDDECIHDFPNNKKKLKKTTLHFLKFIKKILC